MVIPTADRPRLVRRAIASAAAQAGVDVEVIVVDDGRTPLELDDDPRLRVVRTRGGEGPTVARNRGLAVARGVWTAFLDDDDYWHREKLRRQLEAAAAAAAGFSYAGVLHVDVAGHVLAVAEAPAPADLPRRLPGRNAVPAGSSNVVARTDLLRSVGGFDERLWHFSDWELWQRLARRTPAAAVAEPLVAYVQHEANIRARGTAGLMRELQLLDALQRAAGADPARQDRRLLLRWIAGAHRENGRRFRAAGVDFWIGVAHRSLPDLGRGLLTLVSPRVERRLRDRTRSPEHPTPAPAWVARESGA